MKCLGLAAIFSRVAGGTSETYAASAACFGSFGKQNAEGVGAGAGCGTLWYKLPLELRAVETVAAVINHRMAPGFELPRKPSLGEEDAVSAIVERSGEGAFTPEA